MSSHSALDPVVEPVIAAIDAANSLDPNLVIDPSNAPGSPPEPKELVHSRHMTKWLFKLEASPSIAQQIAARAHHFRRWMSPRSEYPEGRGGYLRWRIAARERHVAEVDALLDSLGIDADTRAEVARIVAKTDLATDPVVQSHEDALCLTFIELQGDEVARSLGDDARRVFVKTAAKMSERGINLVRTMDLSDELGALLSPVA